MHIKKLIVASAAVVSLVTFVAGPASASTAVPGHQGEKWDSDGNGYSDAGVYVNGHYTSLFAYDANGDYYWDLGDGRIYKTVPSVDDLDQATLTTCDYVINYRADFGNDPFMNDGWIHNHITCTGLQQGSYQSVIVSDADPRFEGHGYGPGWGPDWEYQVDTWSGAGNQVINPASQP